jgi:hypothetical protein
MGSNPHPLPSASPLPLPSGIPATDKGGPQKVVAALFPETGVACGHDGNFASCPLTPELRRRLQARPLQYVDQLCRCPGPYHSPTFTVTPTVDGAVVKVGLTLDRGQQSLDVSVTHPTGVWLASDVTCTGFGTSTSLFSDAPTNCFAIPG